MLKKFISFAVTAVMAVCSANACFAQSEYTEVATDVPPQMLFLGDSIASGFGLDGYEDGRENCRSYANILSEEYSAELGGECEFVMNNLAIDGQTSTELLEGLKSGEYDEYIQTADCIVISIGGNDMLGVLIDILAEAGIDADGQTEAELNFQKMLGLLSKMTDTLDKNIKIFDSNMGEIASYISENSDGRLIVQTQYNPLESFDKVPVLQKLATEKISQLNDEINAHSTDESSGYSVCDVAEAFSGRADELTRINKWDIHPNEEGHKVIAETLDKTVREEKYSYKKAVDAVTSVQTEKQTGSVAEAVAAAVIIGAIFVLLAVRIIIKIKAKKQ